MFIRQLLAVGSVVLLASTAVSAHQYKAGALEIDHPWARATAPGQTMGAGYMTIKNSGDAPDTLISISTAVATTTRIHQVKHENNMAKMSAVDAFAVPAKATVKLAPGGYHVMFMNIKAPFKEGEKIPATLTFAKAGKVKIVFKVEPLTYQAGHAGHGQPMDMTGHGHDQHMNMTDHTME